MTAKVEKENYFALASVLIRLAAAQAARLKEKVRERGEMERVAVEEIALGVEKVCGPPSHFHHANFP